MFLIALNSWTGYVTKNRKQNVEEIIEINLLNFGVRKAREQFEG
ncbi:MAG: hypothetical protein ACI8QD_001433 [Cyclobacteriaceae bacterium]|jgi:hypothetical protein